MRFFSRSLDVEYAKLAGDHELFELTAAPAAPVFLPGTPPHAAWAGTDQLDDAAETISAATEFAPDWVIVDHYAFDASWHDAVRAALSCRIMVVDDLADRPLAPDMLVDHNLHHNHQAKYAGVLAGDPVLLTSPRYAMIDPVFAEARPYNFRETVDRVGIFLGGADEADVTSAVLHGLREADFCGTIGVVASSANPNLDGLRARIAADRHATLAVDLPDLATFFADHDLQIGAGGGATWERLCLGAPSILLALADNQHAVLQPLKAHDVSLVLPSSWTIGDVCIAVRKLISAVEDRRKMSRRARNMVDGLGTHRIANALLGRGEHAV